MTAGPGPIAVQRHRVLVVGAGVAGLSAALSLGDATIVVDTELGGGSSPWAQGGLAAAMGADDRPVDHADDTLAVSGGIGVPAAVQSLTDDAPGAIAWLQQIGAAFDVDGDGNLVLGREAGHRKRRIVHARGDATGAEVMRALVAAVRGTPQLTVIERTTVVDLVRDGARVVGVYALHGGRPEVHLAEAVVLATGGYGYLFARTTNPPQVAGAAVAMAARAGAAVADVEMVQFHPTALAVPGADPLPLLTEALRGEGAVLVNRFGERYMAKEHADAELAPRDVVARANYRQLQAGNVPALDARASVGAAFPERFPTVFRLARSFGLDPRVDLLPCSPAAHYCMGGIDATVTGATSLPGLWALGEAASTGAHGANRLASNSMVEGVVMGRATARAITSSINLGSGGHLSPVVEVAASAIDSVEADSPTLAEVRVLLWDHAGVVRDGGGLEAGLARVRALSAAAGRDVRGRNALTVASLLLARATDRQESRGAHFRSDFPEPDPRRAVRQIVSPEAVPTARLRIAAGRAAACGPPPPAVASASRRRRSAMTSGASR